MINIDTLITAAKENRVLVLPVARNSTIYIVSPIGIDECTVSDFDFDFTDEDVHIDIIAKYAETGNPLVVTDSDFGYTAFVDIDSAKKAYEVLEFGADESA